MTVQFPKRPSSQNATGQYTQHNPYRTPDAIMEGDFEGEYNDAPIYAMHGRIGRIRFLSYSMIMNLVLMFIVMILVLIFAMLVGGFGANTSESSGVMVLAGIMYMVMIAASLYISIVTAKRRLNDLNRSGWLSLLWFVPLINLVFWLYLVFAAGDEGYNDYGAPALPPTAVHKVFALLIPVGFAMIGILAAIAIPAYQDYVERAQMAQIEQMGQVGGMSEEEMAQLEQLLEQSQGQ